MKKYVRNNERQNIHEQSNEMTKYIICIANFYFFICLILSTHKTPITTPFTKYTKTKNISIIASLELISGVFVRIKDKNLHQECFKCATCGTSLKNQGYYNLHNKLYCDIHARLAALNSPPPNANTNGLVPVTFPP